MRWTALEDAAQGDDFAVCVRARRVGNTNGCCLVEGLSAPVSPIGSGGDVPARPARAAPAQGRPAGPPPRRGRTARPRRRVDAVPRPGRRGVREGRPDRRAGSRVRGPQRGRRGRPRGAPRGPVDRVDAGRRRRGAVGGARVVAAAALRPPDERGVRRDAPAAPAPVPARGRARDRQDDHGGAVPAGDAAARVRPQRADRRARAPRHQVAGRLRAVLRRGPAGDHRADGPGARPRQRPRPVGRQPRPAVRKRGGAGRRPPGPDGLGRRRVRRGPPAHPDRRRLLPGRRDARPEHPPRAADDRDAAPREGVAVPRAPAPGRPGGLPGGRGQQGAVAERQAGPGPLPAPDEGGPRRLRRGDQLFKGRHAENAPVPLSPVEKEFYAEALDLVDRYFPSIAVPLGKMVYGKRAASSLLRPRGDAQAPPRRDGQRNAVRRRARRRPRRRRPRRARRGPRRPRGLASPRRPRSARSTRCSPGSSRSSRTPSSTCPSGTPSR